MQLYHKFPFTHFNKLIKSKVLSVELWLIMRKAHKELKLPQLLVMLLLEV